MAKAVAGRAAGAVKIQRALISVSNKEGITELAQALTGLGVEIISTGGTAKALMEAGIPVTTVSQVTNFPEMLEGRVKTLHPNIHAALLAKREQESHMRALGELGIRPIDMVIVNLYPFAENIARPGIGREEALEEIDIGGPCMIRAAAKNLTSVGAVTDFQDYPAIVSELTESGGYLSLETRQRLARKAFAHTAIYDGVIAEYLGGGRSSLPATLHLSFEKEIGLRYGENPHQAAAFYREPRAASEMVAFARQLQGKELSYNNILDMESAWIAAREWERPAAVIVKHNNPCGIAVRSRLAEAFVAARESDPVSAFGGIIALNCPVDRETAEAMRDLFVEVVIAPAYDPEASEIFAGKKDLRLMELPIAEEAPGMVFRYVEGGLLAQQADLSEETRERSRVVSRREPTEQEWEDLLFAWKAAKHVKSNAIVLAQGEATIGVGAGQMSRLDSSWIAVRKAGDKAKGSVLASDAFFPFDDALEVAAKAGITAAIQPGGSKRDHEVIACADRYGMAMVFTGVRHFRH